MYVSHLLFCFLRLDLRSSDWVLEERSYKFVPLLDYVATSQFVCYGKGLTYESLHVVEHLGFLEQILTG